VNEKGVTSMSSKKKSKKKTSISNKADIRVKFKDGDTRTISINKKVLNISAIIIAFGVGIISGAAAVFKWK